jgi:hypothetical protein
MDDEPHACAWGECCRTDGLRCLTGECDIAAGLVPSDEYIREHPKVAALAHAVQRFLDVHDRWNGDRTGPALRNLRAALAELKGGEV